FLSNKKNCYFIGNLKRSFSVPQPPAPPAPPSPQSPAPPRPPGPPVSPHNPAPDTFPPGTQSSNPANSHRSHPSVPADNPPVSYPPEQKDSSPARTYTRTPSASAPHRQSSPSSVLRLPPNPLPQRVPANIRPRSTHGDASPRPHPNQK